MAPGPSVDVSPLKGKTVFVIPYSTTIQAQQVQLKADQDAGKAAGLNVKIFTDTGLTSQWQQGVELAISEKAAAIILADVDARLIAPQVHQALHAGIAVIDTQPAITPQVSDILKEFPGIAIGPPDSELLADGVLEDYIAVTSGGNAHVLYVSADDVSGMNTRIDTFKQQLAAECPKCTVTVAHSTFASAATATPTAVSAALAANPDINWIVDCFDWMEAYTVPAVQKARRAIKVVSINGEASSLATITAGGPFVADVGASAVALSYGSMDQAIRIMLHLPAGNERDFVRLWTSENIADAGKPPSGTTGYNDDALIAGYTKLWGEG